MLESKDWSVSHTLHYELPKLCQLFAVVVMDLSGHGLKAQGLPEIFQSFLRQRNVVGV